MEPEATYQREAELDVLRRELRASIDHAEAVPFDWRDSRPSPGEVAVLLDALDRAERERDQARQALERVFCEELNGRLCPLPEADSDRCCDACRETWRQVRAALDEEPDAAT